MTWITIYKLLNLPKNSSTPPFQAYGLNPNAVNLIYFIQELETS